MSPAFRAQVPQDASLDFMRGVYAIGPRTEPLHQIMRLDLLMAIAQNDLVKVHRACRQHGVSVRFPYLDPALVDYCGRLAAHYKVRGLKKRYPFKQAVPHLLPAEVPDQRQPGFRPALAAWSQCSAVALEDWFEPAPGFRARLWNAGHILGSASVELEAGGARVLCSGDLGPEHKAFHPDPESPAGFDHVLCESTSQDLEKVLEHFENQFGDFLPQLRWVNFGGGHLMTREGYDVAHLISVLKAFRKLWPHLQVIL